MSQTISKEGQPTLLGGREAVASRFALIHAAAHLGGEIVLWLDDLILDANVLAEARVKLGPKQDQVVWVGSDPEVGRNGPVHRHDAPVLAGYLVHLNLRGERDGRQLVSARERVQKGGWREGGDRGPTDEAMQRERQRQTPAKRHHRQPTLPEHQELPSHSGNQKGQGGAARQSRKKGRREGPQAEWWGRRRHNTDVINVTIMMTTWQKLM